MTHTPDEVLDNAPSDRLHACLAACAGIPTDDLTPGRLAAQDAEIAALKDEVGYWKSQSADFGRKVDDLSDAHDAIVIERDRLREALTDTGTTLRRMSYALTLPSNDFERATRKVVDEALTKIDAALSPEQEPSPAERELRDQMIADASGEIEG